MSGGKDSKAERSMASNLVSRTVQLLGPLAAFVVIILLFAVLDRFFGSQNFLSERNFRTVSIGTCIVALGALGMTVIIISGGIDLSCGTAIALSATVLAYGLREDVGCVLIHGGSYAGVALNLKEAETKVARATPEDRPRWEQVIERHRARLAKIVADKIELTPAEDALRQTLTAQLESLQQPYDKSKPFRAAANVPNSPSSVWLALFMGISTGVLCGALNGVLISGLRVVPFIITLGTASIFLGTGNWLSSDVTVRPSLDYQVPDFIEGLLSNSPEDHIAGLPLGLWTLFLVAILLAIALKFSVFGRYVFALGSNEQTARLCGISVGWNKLAVYAVAGLFIGLAGVMQFSLLSSGSPTSGEVLTLPIIAAVVIGGASLSGGRGSVLGTLAGAAIMAVIISGCNQLGLTKSTQQIFLGVVIISAATIDQVRQRMSGS